MWQITALELDGCPIEELGLDFILPGDGCTELRRGGRDLPVTAHNLHDYITLVTHWLLYEGQLALHHVHCPPVFLLHFDSFSSNEKC